MAALSLQTLGDTGAALTYSAASASDTASIGSGLNTFLHVKNTSAVPVDVLIVVPGNTFFGAANPDNEFSIPAGEDRHIPLRPEYDDGTGRATITFTPFADVDVAVVRMG